MSRLSFHDLLLTINPSLDPNYSDKKNYVLVKRLDGDYKKLKTLSLKEYNNITFDITTRQNVNMFEEKLAQFTDALQKRCIPVDRIEVNGQSGIILTSDLYYKILEEQIRQNAVAHANNIYSLSYFILQKK